MPPREPDSAINTGQVEFSVLTEPGIIKKSAPQNTATDGRTFITGSDICRLRAGYRGASQAHAGPVAAAPPPRCPPVRHDLFRGPWPMNVPHQTRQAQATAADGSMPRPLESRAHTLHGWQTDATFCFSLDTPVEDDATSSGEDLSLVALLESLLLCPVRPLVDVAHSCQSPAS